MTEQQPVICQNCHTEMTPGKKTRSKVMEWTEYTCPSCGSVWSEGKPLPGHEPTYIVPKVKMMGPEVVEGAAPVPEPEPRPEPKPRSKRKAKVAKVAEEVIESEGGDGR